MLGSGYQEEGGIYLLWRDSVSYGVQGGTRHIVTAPSATRDTNNMMVGAQRAAPSAWGAGQDSTEGGAK